MNEQEVLDRLTLAVDEWVCERARREWDENMRWCQKCKAEVNRHMQADVKLLCIHTNMCEAPGE